MKKTVIPMICLAAGLIAFSGCAKKEEVKPEPTPTAQPTPEQKAEAPVNSHYVVRPGDSLWKIAGDSGVLSDSFRWPLLYKANRDQIEDPDLIEPKQDLSYQKQYDESEIADAVKKAQETPKYVPHSAPRKKMPLNY